MKAIISFVVAAVLLIAGVTYIRKSTHQTMKRWSAELDMFGHKVKLFPQTVSNSEFVTKFRNYLNAKPVPESEVMEAVA